MIKDAVILAGGFGTRLASVVSDVPKPMAPVGGRPFLERLLDRLGQQGVMRAVLAVGHMREVIIQHFGSRYGSIELSYSEETEPLGTGGAVKQAFDRANFEQALVFNGDTYCDLALAALSEAHAQQGLALTLALVPQPNASRFGAVELDERGRIFSFQEKITEARSGLINAGIYAADRRILDGIGDRTRFSFETEVLQPGAAKGQLGAYIAKGAQFIDIGVPEDYARAQTLIV